MDIVAVFDEVTSPDTYSGHGHAFEENLVACIQFAVPVSLTESVGEMIEMILDDINSRMVPIDFLTDDKEKQERIRDFLTNERIEEAIRREFPEGTKDEDPFYIDAPDEEDDDEDDLWPGPYQYGYIHIYEIEK